ncbi:MAG TPA: ABC transporter permease [Candidatus Angelobacter sp.]|nr:ABC transporter permease [Candidatus Angelobacter sp.]
MRSFIRKLIWLTQRRRREAEVHEELQFHLEEETEERQEEGAPREQAKWAARRELGNVTLLEENIRSVWMWKLWEQTIQDVRYALRMMRKNPAFALLAALLLALGIGANTAIYSFLDALLVRSLPVADPQSLAVINWHLSGKKDIDNSTVHGEDGYFHHDPKYGTITGIFPYPAYELLRQSGTVFSDLFAYYPGGKMTLQLEGQAEAASAEYVSGNYFRGLGLVPAAGRLMIDDDDRIGGAPVIVLSYAFAQKRFSDPTAAAGQQVTVNNRPFTVIGVTPPGFFGVDPSKAPDFYLPLHTDLLFSEHPNESWYLDQNHYWIEMMGRLRPDVTLAHAQAAMAPVFEQWVASTARNDTERQNLPEFLLREGAGGLDNLRRNYSQPFFILGAMVGLILAIACANIANLLLARATARRRELAVRLSLGAGRGRVIRQLLTESLLLSSVGGAAGVLFAIWGIRALTVLFAGGNDHFTLHAELNWHVLAAAATLTMLTGLLFGLAPALEATKVDVLPTLKEARAGERRPISLRRFGLGRILVVSQIAISLLLLVAAGLFVRTLSNLQSLEMGFNRENVLLFRLNALQAGHRNPEAISFFGDLQKRFAALPGVRSATLADSPLIGDGAWGWPVVPMGKLRPEKAPTGHGSGAPATATHILAAGPGFFSTMQIPILLGREFDDRDRLGSPPVVIVNEAWLKTNLPDRNPIGQHVMSYPFGGMKPLDMEIIGVARDARYDDVSGDFPATVYLSFEQNLYPRVEDITFFLRTTGNPLSYASMVREVVHQADARIPVTNLTTQVLEINGEMSQEILFARLCTGFALLALVIACVGLYGTMSYTVARRTGEIGIRMALGARRGNVVWMVLREVLIMAAVGLVIGVPIALGTSRFVRSFLFEIKPNDPGSLAVAVMILLSAALVAGYFPAWKASRIDPMVALRHE